MIYHSPNERQLCWLHYGKPFFHINVFHFSFASVLAQKHVIMNQQTYPKEKTNKEVDENNQPKTKEQQQKSDPQLTELKGFTDSEEDLEPKGTDNPF
jgi:hypothetical protein